MEIFFILIDKFNDVELYSNTQILLSEKTDFQISML